MQHEKAMRAARAGHAFLNMPGKGVTGLRFLQKCSGVAWSGALLRDNGPSLAYSPMCI